MSDQAGPVGREAEAKKAGRRFGSRRWSPTWQGSAFVLSMRVCGRGEERRGEGAEVDKKAGATYPVICLTNLILRGEHGQVSGGIEIEDTGPLGDVPVVCRK